MNQGNQGSNRDSGSDDRSEDRYGSQDSGYGTERGERDERRTRFMGQRQQEADSGGWLAHRQQGGGDWPSRSGSAQPGAGRDWQGSGQQPGGGSRGSTSISGSSGYGGYEGEARRAGSESGGQYGSHDYGSNEYGEGRYGEHGEGRGGQQGARQPERERWGQWHQEGERDDRSGRGSEWSSQRGSQRDEWGQGPGQGQDWQRERTAWDPRARAVSGAYPRQGGWERGRGDASSDFRGGSQGNGRRESWNDPSRSSPDMRTHYRGGYGVSDYESSADERYRGRQRSAAADWLDERERRERWASGAAGYGGYGRSSNAGPGGYDPDERAYEHFTGASERSGLNRGYGGAGGSAAARRLQHVGPKGYQRSDERIREDLCERLAMSSRIDVREVEVTVTGGVVTLSGTVRDRQQKYRIEDIADEVYGVKDVHNQIRLAREAGASGNAGRTGDAGLSRPGGTLGGLGSPGTSSTAGSNGDLTSSSGSSALGGKTGA